MTSHTNSFALPPQLGGSSNANQATRREQERARREDEQRRRASQQPSAQQGAVVLPSPALVRHGSKRRAPNVILSGGSANTPQSGAAHVNVPAPGQPTNANVARRLSQQQSPHGLGHPYANVSNMSDYAARQGLSGIGDDAYSAGGGYTRTSPMATAAPPALSNVRAMGGEAGVANGYDQQMDREPPRPSLIIRILTCRC